MSDGSGRGWLGVVDTRYGVSQPVASATVEVRVFTRAHVSRITYRVDVYRSTSIGASLLAERDRHTLSMEKQTLHDNNI